MKSKMAAWKKVALGLLIFFVVAGIYNASLKNDAGEVRKQKLLNAYSKAKLQLKSGLKDPDSFEEISHKEYFLLSPDSSAMNMQVVIDYRAKNSFGAFVPGQHVFNFDSTGTITKEFDGLE